MTDEVVITGDEIAISGSPNYDYYTAAYVTKEGISIDGMSGGNGISPLVIPWADVLKHAPAEDLEIEYVSRINDRRLKEMLERAGEIRRGKE